MPESVAAGLEQVTLWISQRELALCQVACGLLLLLVAIRARRAARSARSRRVAPAVARKTRRAEPAPVASSPSTPPTANGPALADNAEHMAWAESLLASWQAEMARAPRQVRTRDSSPREPRRLGSDWQYPEHDLRVDHIWEEKRALARSRGFAADRPAHDRDRAASAPGEWIWD